MKVNNFIMTEQITENNIKSFEFEINVKSHILSTPVDTLQEMVQGKTTYVYFVQMLYCLIHNEPALILLDKKYLDKVYKVIGVHRFDEIGREMTDDINELVILINNITSRSEDEKNYVIENYIVDQCKKRKISILSKNDCIRFINSMIYDAVIVNAIETKDFSTIEDPNAFICTVNYILEEMPELLVYEDALDTSNEYLDEINNNSTFIERIYYHGRKKVIEKTKQKIKSLKEE